MSQWIGTSISLYVKDSSDVYQGQIKETTADQIIISNVFRNGLPVAEKELIFQSTKIANIEIIDDKNEPKTIILSKPKPRRKTIPYSPVAPTTPTKTSTPNAKFNNQKDKQCFHDSILSEASVPDFDFEKNLALFDKKEFTNNANSVNKYKPSPFTKNSYQCNENVLENGGLQPTSVELLHEETDIEYMTPNGFMIPSLKPNMLDEIYEVLDKIGFSADRQNELFARCCTDMIIQLIGGERRLHPQNRHQTPKVAILCANQNQSIVGLIIARQLASFDVYTIVYTNSPPYRGDMEAELNLYSMTGNQIITDLKQMPINVDLIVVALGDRDTQRESDWIQKKKAPVLAINPPPNGMRHITAKISLVPILPLAHSERNGSLYLCNLGIPIQVFNEVGIKYRSPFGSKAVVALHKSID